MKIVIAPDSFKDSLRSGEVCKAVEEGIRSVLPDAEIISVPMADGGEGTVDAVIAAKGGTYKTIDVTGPLGETVKASYAVLSNGKTAIMEMASASGLELVPPDRRNPLLTTTYGTGELIASILSEGIYDIIIGIGGSATVDGGCGMAQALGYDFLDKDGNKIPFGGGGLAKLTDISVENVCGLLKKAKIRVAGDVYNPLLGTNGAARVFAPQKGASPEAVEELEKGLANLAAVWRLKGLADSISEPGDGAAGGLGAGLRVFCNAKLCSGSELMIEITGLAKKLEGVDLIITGEGQSDSQTFSGKLCSAVAALGREKRIPVLLLSGSIKGDIRKGDSGITAAFSISHGPEPLESAIHSTRDDLFFTAQNIAELIKSLFKHFA